jgi:hypothetical protein
MIFSIQASADHPIAGAAILAQRFRKHRDCHHEMSDYHHHALRHWQGRHGHLRRRKK